MTIRRLGAFALVAALLLPASPAAAEAPTPPDLAIQQEQARLRRNPWDPRVYHRLGDAYLQKTRETGDLTYLALAEKALRKSLELAPDSAGAVRHLAYVFSTRHEFAEAAAQARRAIALDPRDGDAHGVLGDACLELGRYDEAAQAYEAMMRLKSDLASYGRRSGLRSITGDTQGAIDDLRRAVEAGRAGRQPRESIAWAEWQLGADHFAIGDVVAAEAQFHAALHTFPGYHRGLAGLAQVRASQGRPGEAVELFARALAVAPLPEYAVALGDLHASMGQVAEARTHYDLVEYLGRLSALNRVLYNRELAYYFADHDVSLDAAVELARRELEIRQDIHAYDLLAWALHKAGRSREALEPMQKALALGTRDARLFFHAGMIHRAVGDREQARMYLARAMATNPHFHVLQSVIATRALEELTAAQAAARPRQ